MWYAKTMILPVVSMILMVSFYALIMGVLKDHKELKRKGLFCMIGASLVIILAEILEFFWRKKITQKPELPKRRKENRKDLQKLFKSLGI